ncbi:myb-related transcription factor, partner of profilin-like isoform X2 [Xenopus laevis]|nr:myb-related transcription factor, partner of profilin-like isoform X2 [Xenopus laevis]
MKREMDSVSGYTDNEAEILQIKVEEEELEVLPIIHNEKDDYQGPVMRKQRQRVVGTSGRAARFSSGENNALMGRIVQHYDYIIGKGAARTPACRKKAIWGEIRDAVNSVSNFQRSVANCKKRYQDIKRLLKKKLSAARKQIRGSDGAPPQYLGLFPYEEQLHQLLGPELEGGDRDMDHPEVGGPSTRSRARIHHKSHTGGTSAQCAPPDPLSPLGPDAEAFEVDESSSEDPSLCVPAGFAQISEPLADIDSASNLSSDAESNKRRLRVVDTADTQSTLAPLLLPKRSSVRSETSVEQSPVTSQRTVESVAASSHWFNELQAPPPPEPQEETPNSRKGMDALIREVRLLREGQERFLSHHLQLMEQQNQIFRQMINLVAALAPIPCAQPQHPHSTVEGDPIFLGRRAHYPSVAEEECRNFKQK